MKVFLDTNILISAALFPNGIAAKAVSFPNQGIISDYSVSELTEVFTRKFPNRIPELNNFLVCALTTLRLITTPEEDMVNVPALRDKKDLPVLRAALAADADILLTGDKDLLKPGSLIPE